MKKNILGSFIIIIIFFVAGFFLINYTSPNSQTFEFRDIKQVKIAGQEIKVDLALTQAEQEQGLSGRAGMGEHEGMLFVFDKPGKYYFWMKDMNFPIDMIWLGEDMKVIYIKKNATPESYPESFGPPDVPTQVGIPTSVGTKYVLEVVSGFSDKNNLKIGDSVEFLYK